jgi:DNA-binding PadR family transcriptional regulator
VSIKNHQNSQISPEYVLLGFLYKRHSHGYELNRHLLDEFGNIWHASQSQTYNILKRLEVQGYLTSTLVEQEKLPSRQLLQITGFGSKRFETWLHQPTNCSVHAIRVEFVTRLYFMQQYFPQNTGDMIRAQLDVVNAGVIQLQGELANLSGSQTYNRLALQLRIKLLYSVISWLDECLTAFDTRKSSEDENT